MVRPDGSHEIIVARVDVRHHAKWTDLQHREAGEGKQAVAAAVAGSGGSDLTAQRGSYILHGTH